MEIIEIFTNEIGYFRAIRSLSAMARVAKADGRAKDYELVCLLMINALIDIEEDEKIQEHLRSAFILMGYRPVFTHPKVRVSMGYAAV
jgi:hypothetical protein